MKFMDSVQRARMVVGYGAPMVAGERAEDFVVFFFYFFFYFLFFIFIFYFLFFHYFYIYFWSCKNFGELQVEDSGGGGYYYLFYFI